MRGIERHSSYSDPMNDQQRSTPQPFDDGPRSTVDPHLLPAANRPPRVQESKPEAPVEVPIEAPTDAQPEAADSTVAEAVVVEDAQQAGVEDTIDPTEFIAEETDARDETASDAPLEESASTPLSETETETHTDPGAGENTPEAANDDTPSEEADVTLTTESGNASESGNSSASTEATGAAGVADTSGVTDASGTAAVTGAAGASAATLTAGDTATEAVTERTGRSRLDEALERSRTIPYEAPVPPASEEEDSTVAETEVVEVTETETVEASGAEARDDEAALDDAERRRDDAAFDDAMLGVTSTEGLIVPPTKRGNRTFALIVAVIATVVFAALYAFAFSAARFVFTPGADILGDAWAFVGTAAFYVPVTLFAVIMIIWSVISNRAGWWSYILASVLLAIVAFGGHYVGIAGQEVINGGAWSNQALFDAMRAAENLPGALIAFIAARESANWVGGLIAARGRRVTKLNKRDLDDYERRVAEERELSGITSPTPAEMK